MESNLVAEFVNKTKASPMEAHNCLQAKGWNMQLAIKDYLNKEFSAVETQNSTISRPLLVKNDSIDVPDVACKKLARGISRATDNVHLVSKARSELGLDFRDKNVCSISQYYIDTIVFTFTLPDLTINSDDFRQFLEKDLIEQSSLVSLEQAGKLNWWAESGLCQRLWPLATTGDGNCLLHAASLGMWGFHDRLLTLRKALHEFLSSSDRKDALYRRWRWQQSRLNAEAGLVYTEEEWKKEWNAIVSMASSTPRNSGGRRRSIAVDRSNKEVPENATYESLEEIHVLALSHVLRRPIIVIADTMLKDVHGEALAPILFGGIYLPLEINPADCHKSPLVLTYDAAHFSALVVMDKETFVDDKSPIPPAVIPVTDSQHKLLPLQFSIDPGDHYTWTKDDSLSKLTLSHRDMLELLKKYMDIVQVPLTSTPSSDENYDIDCDVATTPGDEEDIEKRFTEAADYDMVDSAADTGLFTNKSKATKQLHSVANKFGSIGKSVSKKFKNLSTITKMSRNNSQKKDFNTRPRLDDVSVTSQDFILCAKLLTEARHEYQEEMIKNYLSTARTRFEKEKALKQKIAEEHTVGVDNGQAKYCITPGCNMFGTDRTSYLCTLCYDKQKQEELSSSINSPSLPRAVLTNRQGGDIIDQLRYGTGRSTFYMDSTNSSHETIRNLNTHKVKPEDDTIYLNKSVFYNDHHNRHKTDISSATAGFYPKDWESSPAGTNWSANYDHSKPWLQEDVTNISLLGSVNKQTKTITTPTTETNNNNNKKNNNTRIVTSYNLARDVLNSSKSPELNTVSGGSTSGSGNSNKSTTTNLSSLRTLSGATANATSVTSQGKNTTSVDLPEIDQVTRPSSQSKQHSKQPSPNIIRIPITTKQNINDELQTILNDTSDYLKNAKTSSSFKLSKIPVPDDNNTHIELSKVQSSKNTREKCFNVTCQFYGDPKLENYCSKCYRGRFEISNYQAVKK